MICINRLRLSATHSRVAAMVSDLWAAAVLLASFAAMLASRNLT
jgi:hypothetical protein